MSVTKSILIFLVLSALIVASLTACGGGRDVSCTDAELEEMSAGDLCEILIKKGYRWTKI